jgi:hypothetical protein
MMDMECSQKHLLGTYEGPGQGGMDPMLAYTHSNDIAFDMNSQQYPTMNLPITPPGPGQYGGLTGTDNFLNGME